MRKAFERTDKAIMNALISLLKIKSFDKITVQDILEETPVNRATFYAHFHDKYEVAERMLTEYEDTIQSLYQVLRNRDNNQTITLLNTFSQKKDLVDALLKIHTDTVDLRSFMASGWREKFFAESDSIYKEKEAEIYAQLMTSIQLSILGDSSLLDVYYKFIDDLMIELLIHVTHFDEEDVKAFIWEQIQKRSSLHDTIPKTDLP